MKINVRKAEIEDMNEIYNIELESFSNPWDLVSFLSIIDKEDIHFIVLEIDDKIIGFAVGEVILDEFHIQNIAITPSFRGKRFGEMLFFELLNIGLKYDCKTFFLEVRASNKKAINLYKKYFFVENRIRKDYYFNPIEDAIEMYAISDKIEEAINEYKRKIESNRN